jgi:uncharacterized protein YdhG (YjbR/CyaY superfamily)
MPERTTKASKTARPKTVTAYLAGAPPDQRRALQALRAAIKAAAPDAMELISYGMVGYQYKGQRLIYLAYWKDHVGLYGFSSKWMDANEKELARYDLRGSTLRFAPDKPVPSALIAKIVTGRITEIERAKSAT